MGRYKEKDAREGVLEEGNYMFAHVGLGKVHVRGW